MARSARAVIVLVAAALLSGCGDDGATPAAAVACPVRCDTGSTDGGPPDGGGRDAAVVWEPPEVQLPDPEGFAGTFRLSETGLYVDTGEKELAPDLLAFEPAFWLWSDGTEKHRWLRVPEGERIDVAEMDHWQFPVGTMAFKEFVRDGKRVETRLIVRTGEGKEDYWMGAFAWDEAEADAVFVPDGLENARETDHDVPRVKDCFTCHRGDRGRILGFSAVQQPEAPGELFSSPPVSYRPPGDAVTAQALGYLHANCAHCHNPEGTARPDTDMNLRLSVLDRTPEETATYRSTLGVELQYFDDSPLIHRVVPGRPDDSGLLFRMMERGPDTQMPPLATEITDPEGLSLVRSWIENL